MPVTPWRYGENTFRQTHIVAVEPDPSNCKILRLNLGNKDSNENVTIAETCLAATSAQVYLDRSGDECAYRMTRTPSPRCEPVAAKTFLEIVAEFAEGSVIDLFKCDIEGAESEIFADCSEWINRVHYITIELHPPYTKDNFVADIDRNGGCFEVIPLAEHDRDDLFMARNLMIQ
ncbi:MAG TPA: FkbM family methyltransferase [Pyrinomonadaceae bacterium]|nr:FkbM family methyltransferase [Pyrinomonadaceae bacterium]